MYLILLLSLLGIHVCFSKMAKIILEIRKDLKKAGRKRKNDFFHADYVDAIERIT